MGRRARLCSERMCSLQAFNRHPVCHRTPAQASGKCQRPCTACLLAVPPVPLAPTSFSTAFALRRFALDHRQCGIKYLLAARGASAPGLLPTALPALAAALGDREDAVQAAAADALAPAAGQLAAADPQVGGLLRDSGLAGLVTGCARRQLQCNMQGLMGVVHARPQMYSLGDAIPTLFPRSPGCRQAA